jgi:glycosyltransferase involved in cell wall biosynthesis
MKKVLLVIPSMTSAGGSEKLVDSLSMLLRDSYSISVASFDPLGSKPFFLSSVPYYPLGFGPPPPLPLRIFTYLRAAQRLSALKRRLGTDVAISVLWRADLINVLSRAGGKTISLTVINILNNQTNAMMVKLRGPVGRIYRRFDRILSITPEIVTELQALYRLEPNKFGVFKTFLASPSTPGIFSNDRQRFVFCARAVHEKNMDGLLHAFARFAARNPGRQLVIIGDGPLLDSMKILARELGLSVSTDFTSDAEVLFVGGSPKPEAYMRGAQAFLLTSRHEGVPTVAILAAGLGLPILAADCHGGGMRLLFNMTPEAPLSPPANETGPSAGLLLPIPEPGRPDTLETWVRAMEVADRDQDRRKKWVTGALNMAADHSPDAVRKDWVSIIDTVLAS